MGNYHIPLGLQRDNGKENGNYRDSRDYIGVIKKWYRVYIGVNIGIMEKEMEATVMGLYRF